MPEPTGRRSATRLAIVAGVGLHTGVPVRVMLEACDGPVRFRRNGVEAALNQVAIASTDRATTVEACRGSLRIGTVEHAMSALAGLGIHEGIAIAVDGPEMPLLDGGAALWCAAVRRLCVAKGPPKLRVAREATIEVGMSRYEMAPSDTIHVEVRLQFEDIRVAPFASWDGDSDDFQKRIAPARTFALAHEVDELMRRGLARHVDPGSVVLIAADAIHHARLPFSADEPARHKLLDLIGDLFLFGGPPLGRMRVVRPGHAANARAIRQACAEGVLLPSA